MKVAPEIIAELCRQRAGELVTPLVWQGSTFDKARLLWAVAGVESSFGWNCNPRHEAGYCYGGRYFDSVASKAWGCLAHCSYGPWQVMFPHFPALMSPLSLMWETDGRVAADLCLRGALTVLNRALSNGAGHLGDLVIAYNGPDNEEQYGAKLWECYNAPMPNGVAPVTA